MGLVRLLHRSLHGLVLTACLVQAEGNTAKEGMLERMVRPKASLESGWLSSARVRGSGGSVQTYINRLRINNDFLGFAYTNRNYDWQNVADLPFGNGRDTPIDQSHALKIDARLPYRIDDRWFMLNSLSVVSAFEDQMQNSYSLGVFSFVSYSLGGCHSLQMGIFARVHPVTRLVLPIVSYSYGMRADNGIKAVFGFPRTYVGYQTTPATLLRFGIRFDQSVTRLSDTSPIETGGFIEARNYLANAGIVYRASGHLHIGAELLYSVGRELNVYRSGGAFAETYRIEPSAGISAVLRWLF